MIYNVTSLHDIMHSFIIQGKHKLNKQNRQHFWFPHLHELVVHSVCSRCLICPKWKVSHLKYGHIPSQEAEAEPWERLCIGLIGHYTIKHKGAEPL
jgi:hypothetical protein